MRYLDHIKKHQNLDLFIILFDELGYTDQEIIDKLEISKQTIYDAKTRLSGLLEALSSVPDEKPKEYGNPDINAVIEAFKLSFNTTKASKWDRWAAKRLAEKHSADNMVKIIQALAQYGGEKYCPSVNSVSQLEEKLPSVMSFLKKQQSNSMVEL